jgi:adenylate cyclase
LKKVIHDAFLLSPDFRSTPAFQGALFAGAGRLRASRPSVTRAPEFESPDEREIREALQALSELSAIREDSRAARALALVSVRIGLATPAKAQRLALAALLVGSSLDLDAVVRIALELAVDVMDAEQGLLVLRQDRRVAAAYNLDPAKLAGEPGVPSQAIVERVLETGEPIFTTDAQSDPRRHEQQPVVALRPRSIACVPLRVRDDVIGAVYLDSRLTPALFQQDERELLVAFALQAALAIENARLFEEERDRLARISALQAFQTRILEAIANGVITFSARRRITTFNRAAEATFGLKASRTIGKAATALAKLIPKFPELFDTFFESGAVQLRAEVDARRADGTSPVLEMRLSPLASSEGTGAVLVVTDITKQRRLEQAHEADLAHSRRIEEAFSRYLAPHVVQSLMHDPSPVRLGGQRVRATMLFADIRGFTALSASMSAEQVVEILNAYFEDAVRVVFDHEGLLDKFYGDGLMAVFGPPRVREDDAARAVAAAIRLHEVVAELARRLPYPLKISVGLATGEVVAGHIGSTKRMDYTVIGDAVNLANHLQSAAPEGAIYCDEATRLRAGALAYPVECVEARIKGRDDPIPAYAIVPGRGRTRRNATA